MGNEISRVYQFISNFGSIENWKKKIDEEYGNSDGTVIKTEFRNFMLNEFDFEGDNENDLINKFWASLDTKTTGKLGANGLNNKNALDADELKRAEEAVNATNKINEFVSQQEVPAGISKPDKWKNSVKESLLNKALAFLKQNKDAKAENWDINAAFEVTNRQTTADYVADETIQEKFGEIEGYDADKDNALKRVVDTYVQSLSSDDSTSLDDVVSRVHELVVAYADTADTNSESSIALLGSSYNANGNLNDLQKAVLTQEIKEEIQNGLKSSKSELYSSYQEFIDAKIPNFVKSQLQNLKAKDFNEVKKNISDYTEKFVSAELTDIEKEYKELQDAKKELKDILSGKYTDKYKAGLKELFNTDSQSEIESIIDGYKTIKDVTDIKTKVEAKIDEIDSQLDISFLDGFDDITINASEPKKITLKNYTEKYSTGQLDFRIESGNDVAKVTSLGEVTINGTTPGVYRDVTIAVYDKQKGTKLCTKSITVTVVQSVANILAKTSDKTLSLHSFEDWNEDKSFFDLYNSDGNVTLYGRMDKKNRDWDSMQGTIKDNLNKLCNQISEMFVSAGLDSATVSKAISSVVNAYMNAGAIKNVNNSGTSQGDLERNCDNYMSSNREATKSHIVWTVDEDGTDSNVYKIHFKDLVDDILKQYLYLSEGLGSTIQLEQYNSSGTTVLETWTDANIGSAENVASNFLTMGVASVARFLGKIGW